MIFENETINVKLVEPLYTLFFVNGYKEEYDINQYKTKCYKKTKYLINELYKNDEDKLEYGLKYGCSEFINKYFSKYEECVICQELNDINSKSYGCVHKFHKECYIEHRSNIQDNFKNCPVCRNPFNDDISVENIKYYDHLSPQFNRFAGTRFLGLYSPHILDELVNYYSDEDELKLAVAKAWYSFSYRLREGEPDLNDFDEENDFGNSNDIDYENIFIDYNPFVI